MKFMPYVAACLPLALCTAAHAQPAASCAGKFVGTWVHHGIGGQTNTSNLHADGRALCSDNTNCVQGTWTCAGNVLTYDNGMYKTDYTLQGNGTMTARGGIVVTRVGAAPKQAREPAGSNSTGACGGLLTQEKQDNGARSGNVRERSYVVCQKFENKCGYPVSFAVKSNKVRIKLSATVQPGKMEKICATSEDETLQYLGWKQTL
ncbi:hypothetical protein JQ543_19750 [Bradyrhizobium diazoefficiens]|nr:hypothetical protein [Bradyrhizobium diazoefficiens]MBR0775353.1 hypothetical protein [Bradyrhizobium diazoefficiens]MBR0849996.1 hypothetical protein [Bradyrhizobium diazoefficiens]